MKSLPSAFYRYKTGLYMITAICGLIDAVSFLVLGGVFAEMMTGNLLLLALSIGNGKFFEPGDHFLHVIAIGSFTIGAFLGGYLVNSAREHHRYQRIGFIVEWLVLVSAVLIAIATDPAVGNWAGTTLVIMLSFSMGIQNAMVRTYGVPDLATNVMTLTFTGIIADSRPVRGTNKNLYRRVASVGLFFASAALGALLIQIDMRIALALAAIVFTIALYPLMFGEHEKKP